MEKTHALRRITQAVNPVQLPSQLELDLLDPPATKTAHDLPEPVAAPVDELRAPGDLTHPENNAAVPSIAPTTRSGEDIALGEFRADEFGPLALLVPPGENPHALWALTEQIASAVKPSNILDRLLVHDVARSTMLADFLWRSAMDAYACLEEDTARNLAEGAATAGTKSNLPLDRQVRARTFIDHHALMGKLTYLHNHVRGSRDNSMMMIDSRRLSAVKGALDLVEEALSND